MLAFSDCRPKLTDLIDVGSLATTSPVSQLRSPPDPPNLPTTKKQAEGLGLKPLNCFPMATV